MQAEQTDHRDVLNADSVLNFLTRNPDFFNQHSDVLPRLTIPHDTGGAVSLIEKQVSVLRNKCCTLENSLRDLINVARENEQLHQRLHRLIQEIITAPKLDDVIALSRDNLMSNFNADDVRFLLVGEKEMVSDKDTCICLAENDPGLALFKDNFKKRETRCGQMGDAQKQLLFGATHEDVASAAVIPLIHERKLGLVVLASKDESRFALGKGVMFLNQLGEVLSRRVDTLT